MYIGSDAVHVWIIFLPDLLIRDFLTCTSRNSKNKKLNSCFIKNRTLAHNTIHEILYLYQRKKENPSGLLYFKRENGKPALYSNKLSFSISHSFNYVLIAITVDSEVGIDIEKNKKTILSNRVAGRIFSNQEIEIYLRRKKIYDETTAFYQSWTRQESYFKALGSGIQLDSSQDYDDRGGIFKKNWSERLFSFSLMYFQFKKIKMTVIVLPH